MIYACHIPGIGLGNKMFINAFAYILSTIKGEELVTIPIEYFQNTLINTEPRPLTNPLHTSKFGYQSVDIEKVMNHTGDIVVDSYVQNYEYYEKYKDTLKKFYIESQLPSTGSIDTALHIRNGDYKTLDWYIGLNSYYKILSEIKFKHLDIVTGHIDDDVLTLSNKFVANIYNTSVINDFLFLVNSKNIILSQSTYAWWAAFLGNPEQVIIPVSRKNISKGIWIDNPGQDDINLVGGFKNFVKIIL